MYTQQLVCPEKYLRGRFCEARGQKMGSTIYLSFRMDLTMSR